MQALAHQSQGDAVQFRCNVAGLAPATASGIVGFYGRLEAKMTYTSVDLPNFS